MDDDKKERLQAVLVKNFGVRPEYHENLKTHLLLVFLEAIENRATISLEDDVMGRRVIITEEGKPERSIGFHPLPDRYN